MFSIQDSYRVKDKDLSRVRRRRGDHGDRRTRPRDIERDLQTIKTHHL